MEMQTFQIKVTIKNKIETVLREAEGVDVTVHYFWDSHGQKVWWKEPKTFPKAKLKIVKREYDEAYGENVTDPNKFDHYEDWDLFINDTKVPGECYSYSGKRKIKVTLCEGHG